MRSVLITWLLCLIISAPARAADVLVFAAASLAGPLDEIAEGFARETGHSVTFSYGASSTLARQVAAGAPADMVILANEAWMDHLQGLALLAEGTRRTLLSNRLVLIGEVQMRPPVDLTDLPGIIGNGRLALALTEAVPAGIYARAALEQSGLWDRLQPNVVESDNVRTAQMLVAIGAARFGIVYATDVVQERRVVVLSDIPEELHPPIHYPLALIHGADLVAERFAAYLNTPLARATFTGVGFGLVEQ